MYSSSASSGSLRNFFRGGVLGALCSIVILLCVPGSIVGVFLCRVPTFPTNDHYGVNWIPGLILLCVCSIVVVVAVFVRDWAISREMISIMKGRS